MSASYACFFHPTSGRDFTSLTDKCPECGRLMEWPLEHMPARIGGARVVEAVSRGFYGATYIVERGAANRKMLIKIVPAESYKEFYKKSWADEVRLHEEVATQHQPHFARIYDYGNDVVQFADGERLECDWAEMDFVPGITLDRYILDHGSDIRAAAQIAIDLLEILRVLSDKQKIHNDLHAGNIIVAQLPPGDRRAGALHDGIRAVAIDFGSLADVAREGRQTDQQRVGEILGAFTNNLLKGDPSKIDSRSYRLAAELTRIRELFHPDPNAVRLPEYAELKKAVEDAMLFAAGAEWTHDGSISVAAEGYNAQTLKPGAVAKLLFDDRNWTNEIASGGAQIVLGMRGCGKTMLLRSLDFHARVALAAMERVEPLQRVAQDGFVALYVSAVRLLDARRNGEVSFAPILFAAFAREATRVLMHLEALKGDVDPQSARRLSEVVGLYLTDVALPEIPSSFVLEQALQRLLFRLASGEESHPLRTAASTAFVALAAAVAGIASRWGSPRVLFLLDDVSTRYLDDVLIRDVLAEVLFQNETCAFKVTTETQTWVSVLRSPGKIEALREDRDYRLFNLGERVSRRLKDERWRFLDQLLHKRMLATGRLEHLRKVRPAQILGHRKLTDIASSIASTPKTAGERHRTYSGIEALSAMCVGDIGDTITLFDRMTERMTGKVVSPRAQTEVYQDLCGQRLWELASKNVALKDHALGFARAAGALLRSSAEKEESGKHGLRQYTKIYLRDIDQESFEKIRQLIDAGVFAIEGGVPRAKTKDADPITHFKLVFRKILGLTSFIGLSDRDRFELTGESMRQWLNQPSSSYDVLIRNQDTQLDDGDEDDQEPEPADVDDDLEEAEEDEDVVQSEPAQTNMFSRLGRESVALATAGLRDLTVEPLDELPDHFDELITALGFEDRARVSSERVVRITRADRVTAVRYPAGLGDESISELFVSWSAPQTVITEPNQLESKPRGRVLIDVTGMKSPFVWSSVRQALRHNNEVWIVYTRAETYWPSDSDVREVLTAGVIGRRADSGQLDKLRELVSGEVGAYRLLPLLGTRDDVSRPLGLIAFASPKMQRLEHLVGCRSFDRLEIIASAGDSPRAELSRVAAAAVSAGMASEELRTVPPTDLAASVALLQQLYYSMFVDASMDVALGLTGSKVQLVAMAALSTVVKVAEAWYVAPSVYKPDTFTKGASTTKYFRIAFSG